LLLAKQPRRIVALTTPRFSGTIFCARNADRNNRQQQTVANLQAGRKIVFTWMSLADKKWAGVDYQVTVGYPAT
jgi:hypothetical protein